MDFGFIPNVENVNWTLPATPELSLSYLRKLRANSPPPTNTKPSLQILFGTPAWAHKEWIGKIYPEKTKSADFLYHYSRSYGCIEMNTTHYRIPTAEQSAKWLAQVPADFEFCPKLAQSISHSAQGLHDKALLKTWFEFLESIESHLGICFVQFPPSFDYSAKQHLFHFLQEWPADFKLALEFRHPSWFTGGQILPALTEYLQSRGGIRPTGGGGGIGHVITDVAGRRDVLHSSVSARFSMVRFIGNNLHVSDSLRSKLWAAKLLEWQNAGLEKVYFIVHEPDDILAPEMTEIVAQDFSKAFASNFPFPRLPTTPKTGDTQFTLPF